MRQSFILILGLGLTNCDGLKAWMLKQKSYEPTAEAAPTSGTFGAIEQRYIRHEVKLSKVIGGLSLPVDLVFLPGKNDEALIAEKNGALKFADFGSGKTKTLKQFDVLTASEEGLLGVALHPEFGENLRLYVDVVVSVGGKDTSQVIEYEWDQKSDRLTKEKILLQVEQPYPNHNGGQVAFGPDGFLYIAFGDGGWRDDPKGNGQNRKSLLGKILRIDVNSKNGYAIPKSNPFKDKDGAPEIFAYGMRNPWRFTFADKDRLIVADVGQNAFEEVSVIRNGDNAGWNWFEGRDCFKDNPKCKGANVKGPFVTYGRDVGTSITGGVVYRSDRDTKLRERYLYGDFTTGRLFAARVPSKDEDWQKPEEIFSLGKWPISPVAFASSPNGDAYVVDFGGGVVFKIDPVSGK
jgi:glucose/arabinose dehydrogenase